MGRTHTLLLASNALRGGRVVIVPHRLPAFLYCPAFLRRARVTVHQKTTFPHRRTAVFFIYLLFSWFQGELQAAYNYVSYIAG